MEKLRGIKVLLMGGPGTGKTHSIRTFLDLGIQPFVIATDNGFEVLGDVADKCIIRYIAPALPNWEALRGSFALTNQLSYKSITEMTDTNRNKYMQLLQIVDLCANFTDNDGNSYGDVSTWNTDRVLVIDNLTGINKMCLGLVVGGKPVKSQPEWQMAMDHELKLVGMWCSLMCHMVLIAHIEREKDEITGGENIMASALGRKNAPQLPTDFSDVITTKRQSAEFFWRTDELNMDLKTRNLPLTGKHHPSFPPLIQAWKKRGGVIEPSPPMVPKKA